MSTTTKLITAEELWHMPQSELRHELVRGELSCMAPAGFDHGAIGINFLLLLAGHVKRADLGTVVGADTGFLLRHNPDTVRAPDVAFVRKDRIPNPRPVKFWEGAPDLAVEVISTTDTAAEIDDKVQEYLDAGAVEVIVINPKLRTLKIYRHGTICTVLREGDCVEDLKAVPGFRCSVADVFA